MPEATATARYVRVSPRKARRVIDLIRGRDLKEARGILRLVPSPTARTILKVLDSAAANAEANHDMDRDFLWVSRCYVDGGPNMRRLRIGSIGRGGIIRRRMSHITVVLDEREELREAAREEARRRRQRRERRAAKPEPAKARRGGTAAPAAVPEAGSAEAATEEAAPAAQVGEPTEACGQEAETEGGESPAAPDSPEGEGEKA
ncbi:hypothetical protein AMK68_00860 [candidate division KD3-62 bacterium DG_56]|uniref:Large ribosomal subunit protein uL22 n=1 Tax=candidate division KD3-62 bacterium DG_56 TaxID=1704032 RepID=A0A0S7XQD4_9BACT|nr:MAG: hypothetical protein AMK68_00860 [candidate division KD3-62 bacterium DG_56]